VAVIAKPDMLDEGAITSTEGTVAAGLETPSETETVANGVTGLDPGGIMALGAGVVGTGEIG